MRLFLILCVAVLCQASLWLTQNEPVPSHNRALVASIGTEEIDILIKKVVQVASGAVESNAQSNLKLGIDPSNESLAEFNSTLTMVIVIAFVLLLVLSMVARETFRTANGRTNATAVPDPFDDSHLSHDLTNLIRIIELNVIVLKEDYYTRLDSDGKEVVDNIFRNTKEIEVMLQRISLRTPRSKNN